MTRSTVTSNQILKKVAMKNNMHDLKQSTTDSTRVNAALAFLGEQTSHQLQSLCFIPCNAIYPSLKLDTTQHWASIGKNVAEDRLPISCCCWNDNPGMHLAANPGPNSGRQQLFSAQQRADAVPNSGFLSSRMFYRGKSDTCSSNMPSMGRTEGRSLALSLSELEAIVKVTISLV